MGRLDVRAAGFRVWVVAGPVDPPPTATIVGALDRLGSGGPLRRVGLQPSPVSSRWRFDPIPGPGAVLAEPAVPVRDAVQFAEGLASVRPTTPVVIARSGEYLAFGFDHGIGDAHIMLAVIIAVSHAGKPTGTGPVAPANTNHPFRWALPALIRSPRKLSAGLKGVSSVLPQARRRVRPGRSRSTVPPSPQDAPVVVFVRSAPGFVTALSGYRRAAGLRVSLAVLVMTAICEAFRATGVEFDDRAEVVTDLRRYLPAGRSTLANFTSVVSVPCPPGTTAQQFGDALTGELASAAPLLLTAGSLLRARSSRRRAAGGEPRAAPADPTGGAVLSFSDLTKLELERIAWTRPNEAEFMVMLPPGSAAHLTIALYQLGDGEIQVTATFFPEAADVAKVRQGLELALSGEDRWMC